MTAQEAKEILLRFRPGTRDGEDPEVAEALSIARSDPALSRWFEEHCEFQKAVRTRLREVPVPAHFKNSLLAQRKIIPLRPWWQSTPAIAAAAAVIVAVVGLWVFGDRSHVRAPGYTEYQMRMVATVLREYRMDVETPNLAEVRGYMKSKGSPEDFELTQGLQRLDVAGGGFLRWRNNPVSMVCFRRPDREMVYLFVMHKDVVKDPPPADPKVENVHDLQTAAWTSGDKTYLLAAPPEKEFKQKYL